MFSFLKTGFDVNISRDKYLVVSFHMMHLMNQRYISNVCDGPFFAKIVNDYKSLTIFAKKFCHRCSTGF